MPGSRPVGPMRSWPKWRVNAWLPEASGRPRHARAVAQRITAYRGGVQERLPVAEHARVEAQAPKRRPAGAALPINSPTRHGHTPLQSGDGGT